MSKKPPLPPPPPPPRPEPKQNPELESDSEASIKKKFTPIRKYEPSKSKSIIDHLKPEPGLKGRLKEGLKITRIPEGLVTIGLVTMLGTLWFYKTTICEYRSSYRSRECSYNIGLIGQKNNLIIVGGFLFLGGCVLCNSRND